MLLQSDDKKTEGLLPFASHYCRALCLCRSGVITTPRGSDFGSENWNHLVSRLEGWRVTSQFCSCFKTLIKLRSSWQQMSIIPHNLLVKGEKRCLKSETQLISVGEKVQQKGCCWWNEETSLGSQSDLLPGNSCFVSNTRNILFWFFHNSGSSVVRRALFELEQENKPSIWLCLYFILILLGQRFNPGHMNHAQVVLSFLAPTLSTQSQLKIF